MGKLFRLFFIVAFTVATSAAWAATPCAGVNRGLTNARKVALAPRIAKQLNVLRVDVLESFQFGGWSFIYVDTHESDDAFLFYSHDPLTSRYLTLWGGSARIDEEQGIKDWTIKNASGIPPRLASCFAWRVTNDRRN